MIIAETIEDAFLVDEEEAERLLNMSTPMIEEYLNANVTASVPVIENAPAPLLVARIPCTWCRKPFLPSGMKRHLNSCKSRRQ